VLRQLQPRAAAPPLHRRLAPSTRRAAARTGRRPDRRRDRAASRIPGDAREPGCADARLSGGSRADQSLPAHGAAPGAARAGRHGSSSGHCRGAPPPRAEARVGARCRTPHGRCAGGDAVGGPARRPRAGRAGLSGTPAAPLSMRRALIIIGVLVVLAGLAWPWLSKLPLGRLPGDIVVDRPGMKFYFPIVTSLLVSAVITIVLWLTRR